MESSETVGIVYERLKLGSGDWEGNWIGWNRVSAEGIPWIGGQCDGEEGNQSGIWYSRKPSIFWHEAHISSTFGNVIFSCGVIYENDIVKLYYGAADTHMCYAELPISDIRKALGI